MVSFYTQRTVIQSPPRLPIPGDGGVIGWLRDGVTAVYHRLPSYVDGSFTAACQFFLIANEITLRYIPESAKTTYDDADLGFAECVYQRLFLWSERAGIRLMGDCTDSQHMIILNMWM